MKNNKLSNKCICGHLKVRHIYKDAGLECLECDCEEFEEVFNEDEFS
jgi:hypothetical protein